MSSPASAAGQASAGTGMGTAAAPQEAGAETANVAESSVQVSAQWNASNLDCAERTLCFANARAEYAASPQVIWAKYHDNSWWPATMDMAQHARQAASSPKGRREACPRTPPSATDHSSFAPAVSFASAHCARPD